MILKTDIDAALDRLCLVQLRLGAVARHREAPVAMMARCLVDVLDFASRLDVAVSAAELTIPQERTS